MQNHDALHHVAQLAHIPRPGILAQRPLRAGRQRLGAAPVGLAELIEKVFRQHGDVLDPLAQRRHEERNHVEPIEQVLAKVAPPDLLFQVLIRRRDHPHVHLHGLARPDRLETLFLQSPQHLGLRVEAHVADLIKEERAAVGLLKLADLVLSRAGERACTCPNSSLSMSSSGIAAQFTSTNGSSARRLRAWMACAISSLPTPPRQISTRPSVGAISSSCCRTAFIGTLSPRMR